LNVAAGTSQGNSQLSLTAQISATIKKRDYGGRPTATIYVQRARENGRHNGRAISSPPPGIFRNLIFATARQSDQQQVDALKEHASRQEVSMTFFTERIKSGAHRSNG
jgi:hypothetical protein